DIKTRNDLIRQLCIPDVLVKIIEQGHRICRRQVARTGSRYSRTAISLVEAVFHFPHILEGGSGSIDYSRITINHYAVIPGTYFTHRVCERADAAGKRVCKISFAGT